MRRRHLFRPTCSLAIVLLAAGGCAVLQPAEARRAQAIAAAAQPILALDPNACWTECYNQLLAFGPDALAYLMAQPALTRPAAPDDLAVLMHLSLVRVLAAPGTAPRLSAQALETTLGILHCDPKVGGERLGTAVLSDRPPPRAWLDLYPADFDQALAARVDLEADRQQLRSWWAARQGQPEAPRLGAPLAPQVADLWRVLARRPADRWFYGLQGEPVRCDAWTRGCFVLCGEPPRAPALFDLPTWDYNLVRATCIWLGTQRDATIEARLVELVASPDTTLAHNALFALRYSRNERIRAVLKRYEARETAPLQRTRAPSAAL